jgi:Cu/Ag efflux protein CusF
MRIKTLTLSATTVMMMSSLALAAQVTQDGNIDKMDKGTSMVTITHGPPKEQPNSPAGKTYTYDYKIPDSATFNSLKVGDKVHFVADDMGTSGKDWTVTKIEKQ